jgi:hypothetical protein
MALSPDKVCRKYAGKNMGLTIRSLGDEDNTILIEGGTKALRFLAELFLAQARADDCGFQIGRSGAGKALFSKFTVCIPKRTVAAAVASERHEQGEWFRPKLETGDTRCSTSTPTST